VYAVAVKDPAVCLHSSVNEDERTMPELFLILIERDEE